ncbi:MAG: polyprenyl synthetase family protein [Peptococcaceae bacterium]|jgi:geranylgeranyl diphosphate synthase type II|nr:polyprenyl synthetase family protein [Peptococcaceae bacterium]
MFDLKRYLLERASWINERLADFVPSIYAKPFLLSEAIHYSLFAGGKRLRPILCVASAEAAGGDGEAALPVACALEMIHTYSLVHDDLPCMDDDDYRRGKLTSHKVYGENMAILVGDALLTHAFTVLSSYGAEDPAARLQIIREISRAAGPSGMVAGQTQDVLSEGRAVDPETLEYIHVHKTGDMFAAAIRSGAMTAGAPDRMLDALTEYAEAFGMAFQITDDILDMAGDSGKMGKTAGGDNKLGKGTYPSLFGLERSREMARDFIRKGLRALEALPEERTEPLRAIIEYLAGRET